MKRELLCPACGRRAQADLEPTARAHREGLLFLRGDSINAVHCDHCNVAIASGAPVVAMSIWSLLRGIPYVPWETDALEFLAGGPEKCPIGPCVDCKKAPFNGHHFWTELVEFPETDDEDEEGDVGPGHPSLYGLIAWCVCKHCPAWMDYEAVEAIEEQATEASRAGE